MGFGAFRLGEDTRIPLNHYGLKYMRPRGSRGRSNKALGMGLFGESYLLDLNQKKERDLLNES